MALYIFESDALVKLAAVEGERWRLQQQQSVASPYGFFAWLKAWQEKAGLDDPTYADEPLSSFIDGGDGALYGSGGFGRYAVSAQGEVVLLSWSAVDEAHRDRARGQGITLR